MPTDAKPRTPAPAREREPLLRTALRAAGLLVLVGAGPLALLHPLGLRVVWYLVVAALPLGIVLAGYHAWRRVCPLAFLGTLGQRLKRQGKRKAGDWLGAHHLDVQLGLLALALAVRLLAANDSPWALAMLFAVVMAGALLTGFAFTGKTWCNHFCPVGLIEKLYLEPTQLAASGANSQCAACTACKKNCPDIDLEQAYWKEADLPARRRAYLLWPGLVLGYFLYPWLASGTWNAYTRAAWLPAGPPPDLLGPGLWFLPAVPRLAAVPMALVLPAGLGLLLFRGLEAWLARRTGDPAQARHRAQALAAFTGFLLFYGFAGRALLSLLPAWLGQLLGLGVAVAATLVLRARWSRREEDFVREKFAKGLLKRWEWGELPATDQLGDLYLLHQERVQQREARLAAYKATLRDLLAEGVLSPGNLRLLQRMRAELGISDKEHAKVVAELDLEDARLLDPEYRGTMERQLQRDQYRAALASALLDGERAPDPAVLDALRRAHGIDLEEHDALLASLRGESGPLRERLRPRVAELQNLRRAETAAGQIEARWSAQGEAGPARVRRLGFLRHVLTGLQRRQALLILGLLERLPGGRSAASLRPALEEARGEAFPAALRDLAASEAWGPLAADLAALAEPVPASPDPWAVLDGLRTHDSPYLGATLLCLLADGRGTEAEPGLRAALLDARPLVRETAQALLEAPAEVGDLAAELQAEDDQAWLLRVAVQALPDARGLNRAGQATLRQPRRTLDSESPLATVELLMHLHAVPLFSDLEPEELGLVAASARTRRWSADESLCRQGERSDEVFLVLRGMVRAWLREEAGQVRILADSGPGECLGEMAALDAAPRSATLTALEPVEALVLGGRAFRDLLHTRPEVGEGMLRVLSRRLRGLLQDPSGAPKALNP